MKNTNIINTIADLHTVDYLSQYTKGKFRMITKVRAGFTSCSDARPFDNERMMKNPESIISGYKRGALQTVEFCPDGGDYYLTVFARVGKKVKFMDEAIMAALTVGTINGMFDNTNLMDMYQYKTVNSKTWADKAFTMNTAEVLETA
jgi:hypothetical protein